MYLLGKGSGDSVKARLPQTRRSRQEEQTMATEVKARPGHGTAGRHPTREFLDTLTGHDDPGMFGRMFPTLEPLAVGDVALRELADAMKDPNPSGTAGNSKNIAAGFTYLGQFVDHD